MEKCAHRRAHTGKPHVVSPDDEGKKANHEHGKDERFVTPERFARIVSQDFSDDPESGQDEHVHFRMTEEPKEMLPQNRAATSTDVERNAIALLSNFERSPTDPPSRGWLGHQCNRKRIRKSGLWNSNHVDESYDPEFLSMLERLTDSVEAPR